MTTELDPAASARPLQVTLDGLFALFEFPAAVVAYLPDLGDEHVYQISLLTPDGSSGCWKIPRGTRYDLRFLCGGCAQFKSALNLIFRRVPPKQASPYASFVFPRPRKLISRGCASFSRSSFSGQHASIITTDPVTMSSSHLLAFEIPQKHSRDFTTLFPDTKIARDLSSAATTLTVRSGPPDGFIPADDHSYRAFSAAVGLADALDLRLTDLTTTQIDGDTGDVLTEITDTIQTALNILTLTKQDQNQDEEQRRDELSGILSHVQKGGDIHTCPRGPVSSFL